MYTKIDHKHPDIIFLERRLAIHVTNEDYERAAVLKRWIDELLIYHHGIFINDEYQKNHKRRTTH